MDKCEDNVQCKATLLDFRTRKRKKITEVKKMTKVTKKL